MKVLEWIKFKYYRFLWAIAPFVRMRYPLHIDIELTNRCNLDCIFCFRKEYKYLPQDMDIENVKYILRKAKKIGTKSVKFNWRGESTIYKDYIEAIIYAKKLGLYVYANTSLSALYTVDFLQDFAKYTDVLKVSIDSVNPEMYEKIRKGGRLEQTLPSLIAVSELRRYYKKSKVIISRRRIKDDNLESDALFKKVLGVSYVKFDIKDAIVRNREGVFNHKKLKRKYCGQPSRRLVIAVDGNVYSCCVAYNEDTRLCYGNIEDDSLKDIWNGKHRRMLRYRLKNNKFIGTCKTCTSNDGWRSK
jgi:radical SAM protein with 4Fe4S-binding SPASM domain